MEQLDQVLNTLGQLPQLVAQARLAVLLIVFLLGVILWHQKIAMRRLDDLEKRLAAEPRDRLASDPRW